LSKTYIPSEVRRLVAKRADFLCEYCLLHEEDTFFGCEIDHVVSEKHGGGSEPDNLAYACLACNRNKGSDIASLAAGAMEPTRLFNPRRDQWKEHFRFTGQPECSIEPLSPIGEVSIRVLRLNALERRMERRALLEVERYPAPEARQRMR